MPVLDITRPEVIKFLNESYDRTARLRMKWNIVHADKLNKAAALTREQKGYTEMDVIETSMGFGMSTITRDHEASARNRMQIAAPTHIPGIKELWKGHSIVEVGLGDPEIDPRLVRPDAALSPDPIMRPVDPKLKKIIYKDVPLYGREVYLKKRYKTAPEDKFYFQESSGWEYGWRLKDSYFSRNATKYGRFWRLTRELRGRSGPQPDPDHYKSSEPPGISKCS